MQEYISKLLSRNLCCKESTDITFVSLSLESFIQILLRFGNLRYSNCYHHFTKLLLLLLLFTYSAIFVFKPRIILKIMECWRFYWLSKSISFLHDLRGRKERTVLTWKPISGGQPPSLHTQSQEAKQLIMFYHEKKHIYYKKSSP